MESLCIGEDVVSARARAVSLGPTGWHIVFAPPLGGVSPYVEPSAVIEVLLQYGDFVRIGIKVAKDESGPWRLGFFFVEDGVEKSVGFEGVFCDGGSSSVAIGVVRSWIDMVFKV